MYPKVLKELTEESVLLLPLFFLFVFSLLRFGTIWKVPERCVKTCVVLIFKKDKLNDPNNYSPVSLKLIWSKAMEWLTGD